MAVAREALWQSGHDESVEVNQRALIDKVLARYSGEFTVFRELLQNSDDAGAKAVEIHFDTKKYLDRKDHSDQPGDDAGEVDKTLPDLKTTVVHQWTFKNNGMVFRDEDWSRLKKIAEGNPDEEKIGAFGVGFYSLFSVTEEPFVTSGGQWMGFYWKDKKDQLFARRGTLPSGNEDPWTTFEMPLRESAPIPPAFDFTRFLASSITFMVHLLEVSVFLDGKRLSKLTKSSGVPTPAVIPKGLKVTKPQNTMQVTGIQTTPLHIKAEVMRWVYMVGSEKPIPTKHAAKIPSAGGFFSSLLSTLSGGATPQRTTTPALPASVPEVDQTVVYESSVSLSIFTAEVSVRLDQKMKAELLRSTKKNPPAKTRLELIYTGKDEYDASKKEEQDQPGNTGSVFKGLRADLDGDGAAKVFIGHSTGQTTGIGGHIAARFIPTVERESIDLVDRTVAVWNKELLYVGGFLARAAYELEMESIRTLWTGAIDSAQAAPSEELQTWLRSRSLHALKFFTYHSSTPSALVASHMEDAFFACAANGTFAFLSAPHAFPIISTAGIQSATDVRIPDPAFSGFLKRLPMLPTDILDGAPQIVQTLRLRGMIRNITFMDVLDELRDRPLSEAELIACFKWWVGAQNQGKPDELRRVRTELLNAAVVCIGSAESSTEKIVPISSIQSFVNLRGMGAIIPTDSPLPPSVLPLSISKHFDPQDLSSVFSWREFTIPEWLKFVVTSPDLTDVAFDITKSPQWAERVLHVLSRAWQSLNKPSQEEVVALLKDTACVPTSAGMKPPEESYFQSAHVFRDLPIVTLPSGMLIKANLEKVLLAIGVRKHVDLQIVFNRMIKTGDWTIAELIKYLVAVQSTLTPAEMDRLRMTAAFPKEDSDASISKDQGVLRYKASDLFEPSEVFRKLGLPIIAWGNDVKWRSNSEEAKFLYQLGLQRYPSASMLLKIASTRDSNVRSIALEYFLNNFATRYSDFKVQDVSDLAFIPATKSGKSFLAKPHEVYASPIWATLGFAVVDSALNSDALTKLKIESQPPTSKLISLLEASPPPTEAVAREWLGVLASRISDFTTSELTKLSQLPIVPLQSDAAKGSSMTRLLPPSQCYFKDVDKTTFHSKLFVFVDFGTQANRFLSACGTKHEPSVEEIARILLDNPRQFFQLAEGRENFLRELRNIAVNRRILSSGIIARLKRSPALLGSRRIAKSKSAKQPQESSAEQEEDDWELEYDLLRPDQIVIADDTNAYQLFGTSIFSAPQEDLLEEFYLGLGSKRLSSLIKEEYRVSNEIRSSRQAAQLRALILERLPLFLHEHTHAQTRVPYSWLNNDKNFIVKSFGKLTVIKSLNLPQPPPSRSQDASAAAKRIGRGPIELWLSGNDVPDMYEVSTSLCRLLFEAPKVNDALLFMTILSTDLRALRRRGYNVDRILRQQKAEREAAEERIRREAKEQAEKMSLIPQPSEKVSTGPDPPPPESIDEKTLVDHASQIGPAAIRHTLNNLKRRFTTRGDSAQLPQDQIPSSSSSTLTPSANETHDEHEDASGGNRERSRTPRPKSEQLLNPSQPSTSRPRTPQTHVTPRSNVLSNIDMAIKACRGERGQSVQNKEHMQIVKESLDEGYCDVSGHAVDMTLVGEMGGVKIFLARDVPNDPPIVTTKADTIARFIHVIRPLAQVYSLPISSLHIFYDSSGGLIAFNRNASLFLNLRYFEAWHDEKVKGGDLIDAYVSWYFTLAHEIAHNLVQPHNSEHEFYFSSTCEAYLPAFVKLLTTT